jgi:hypothetical protein
LNDVEVKINQAKQEYTELKQKAREQAAEAAKALSHALFASALYIPA